MKKIKFNKPSASTLKHLKFVSIILAMILLAMFSVYKITDTNAYLGWMSNTTKSIIIFNTVILCISLAILSYVSYTYRRFVKAKFQVAKVIK